MSLPSDPQLRGHAIWKTHQAGGLVFGGVHGFRVKDKGLGTTDTLEEPLEALGNAFDPDGGDYGHHHLLKTRFAFLHYEAVQRIALAMVDWDCVVSHSNGHPYTERAMQLLHQFRPDKRLMWFSISPARDPDAPIPAACAHLWVYCTPNDRAVKTAIWRPCHDWGEMGAVGYQGPDQDRATTVPWPWIADHSAWFKPPDLAKLATNIHNTARKYHAKTETASEDQISPDR